MASETLRQELLDIPGIADADVAGDQEAPSIVRVVLAEGADPETVGARVQKVLAQRGMSSSVDPGVAPPPPPGAPASVVPLHQAEAAAEPSAAPGMVVPPPPSAQPTVVGARLGAIAVEEGRTGVVVTASAEDGRFASVRARRDALDTAIVAAVAHLTGPHRVAPLLVDVIESSVDGTDVVTVVIERSDGRRVSGSAVVESGPAFALAMAAWSALSA